jgi:hypothetical protein
VKRVVGLTLFLLSSFAVANDGWVGTGGTPKLMKGHPSVRMLREKVRVRVEPTRVVVQADFWFRNGGPETTVDVGFPDDDTDDYGEGKPVLKNFRSWVEGRLVKTQLRGNGTTGHWHVKSVRFPQNRTVHIRDRYETAIGVDHLAPGYFGHYVGYTVSTGSSWKGTIGETDLQVTFDPRLPAPRRVMDRDVYNRLTKKVNPEKLRELVRNHRHTVFATGIGKPTLRGRTLVYLRRNWRPTEEDDLSLVVNVERNDRLERQIAGD